MPTTTGGLNFTYPNQGATGWYSTWVTMANVISAHDHSGAPNGTQIPTGGIADDAVDDTKINLNNDGWLTARNNADSADVNVLKLNTSDELVIDPETTFTAGVTITNDLQLDGSDILDSAGLELLRFSETATAVNEVTITNAATGGNPSIAATGDDTHIDLVLSSKGTSGQVQIDHWLFPTSDGSANQILETDGSGNLSFVDPAKVLQVVRQTSSTKVSTTAQIPLDGTTPQNTEGTELITQSITPKSSTSTLYIKFNCDYAVNSVQYKAAIFALFKDSDADALSAFSSDGVANANGVVSGLNLCYAEASTDTSARTFKIRYGNNDGTTTIRLLQSAAGTQYFNAKEAYSLEIWEVEA